MPVFRTSTRFAEYRDEDELSFQTAIKWYRAGFEFADPQHLTQGEIVATCAIGLATYLGAAIYRLKVKKLYIIDLPYFILLR